MYYLINKKTLVMMVQEYSFRDYLFFPLRIINQYCRQLTGDGIKSFRNIIMIALSAMENPTIILADDDEDDCLFFTEVINEVKSNIDLKTVSNGEELMASLGKEGKPLPTMIFLDLNMPVKNGYECLAEIRTDDRLKHIPVIIYSTTSDGTQVEETFRRGANFYVRKPDSIQELRLIAKKIFALDIDNIEKPSKEKFIISAKS